MTTKAQRRQRKIAEIHGKQFSLERVVLNAARALRGSVRKHGPDNIPAATWIRFFNAEDALHAFHAERQRLDAASNQDSPTKEK